MSMPFADRELQARLLRETHELDKKRLDLESAIKAVDAASKLRMENAALRDIEAYRHLHRLHLSHAHEIRNVSGVHEQ
jgi:AmiR/NasT family two-component response regulator